MVLEEAVAWHPGDEAVIISGMSVEGTGSMEEVVVVETVHNAELHLRTPLRYSNYSGEDEVLHESASEHLSLDEIC